MKKCPECSRTYSDETLSFCLDDGALLSASIKLPEETQVLHNSPQILPPTVAVGKVEVPTRAAVNNELSGKALTDARLKPTPDNPPWNSLAAFGIWVASFLFIAVVPLFLVIPYVLTQKVNLSDGQAFADFLQNDPTAILLGIIGVFPAHFLTLVLAWMVVTRLKKYSFTQTLGWRSGGFRWWHYPLIFLGIMAVAAVVTYFYPEQDNELLRVLRSSTAAVYAVAIMATLTAPLVEEVVYRGVLYSAFQRTFGIPAAVVFVTIIFASVHFVQYWGSPSTIFLICFLSLILTLVRVYSKNLLPCIILHTVINGVQSIFLVLQTFLPDANAVAVIQLLK